MIISAPRKWNKIALTEKAPGDLIRVNIVLIIDDKMIYHKIIFQSNLFLKFKWVSINTNYKLQNKILVKLLFEF